MKTLYLSIRNILSKGQTKKLPGLTIVFVIAFLLPCILFAQAPAISYNTQQTYAVGIAITPLLPANKGGAVGGVAFSSTPTTVSTGLSDATCMAMDKSGDMYIGESSGKVSVLSRGGRSANVIASGFAAVTGIAVDASSHNVYVADGTFVWEIAAIGNLKSKLGSFHQPAGVAVDGAGNIYVADASGAGLGGVFKMAADGTAQVRIDNRGAATIALDRRGNSFFTNGGSVFELPAGGTEKMLPGFLNAIGVTTDRSGNIYVACGIAGSTSFCMLPASGGLPTVLKPIIPGLAVRVGLMVDANFNLYAASGSTIRINAVGGYFISPELPQGLTLNPTNGAISGTPTAASPATDYTVKAFNAAGSSTATLNLRLSTDADLNQFNAGINPLTPAFSANTTSYTINAGNATSSITIRPVSHDPGATMTLNGIPLISGKKTRITLAAGGLTTITVVVTAPDRTISKTYTLAVNRPPSGPDGYNPLASDPTPTATGTIVTDPTHTILLADDGIKVHPGVSANGDGIDDFLQIDNISQYPDNKLMIMNRNGQLVYEAKGYDNSSKVFDGRSNKNGQMQSPGTYFFQLDYTVHGIAKHKTGFLVLKR